MYRLLLSLSVFAVLGLSTGAVQAHTVFKKMLEKKYPGVRVSCEACHVKGKPKTERNEFGQVFFEQLKDQDLTKQWQAFEEDKDGKAKFEKETMLPAFEKALEVVKEAKNKEEVAYDALIKDVKLPGLKVKKASSKDDDDEDKDDKDDDK